MLESLKEVVTLWIAMLALIAHYFLFSRDKTDAEWREYRRAQDAAKPADFVRGFYGGHASYRTY